MENGQIWPSKVNKLCIRDSSSVQRTHATCFPCSDEETANEISLCVAPAHKHVGGLIRTRHCQVTSHLICYWFARNLRIQITGKSFWEKCPTFTTHLSLSLMWALKSQGRVNLVFFLTWNTWFLHKHHPIPNTQGVNHSQLTSDTVSVELVLIPQVEGSILSWLQMSAMCSRVTRALDQVTKSGSFHDPTSMLNNNRTGQRAQEDSYCSKVNVQDKTQEPRTGGDV